MKMMIELTDGQYKNLSNIQNGSIDSKMILEAVKKGVPFASSSEKKSGKWIKKPYKLCSCPESENSMHYCCIAKNHHFRNLTEEERQNCPYTTTEYEIVCMTECSSAGRSV